MPENTPKLFAHIQPAAPAQTDGSARVSGPAAPDRAGASAGCYTADSGEQELALLRQLLLNREIEGISDLRGRLNALAAKLGKLEYAEALSDPKVHAAKVGDILAEAVLLRSNKDNNLSMAMGPIVDDIVKKSMHDKMRDFINAMFPLMGPAIRKSISESFRAMMVGFSKSMEMAFSWKGLRWRMEALRTGKPFSEVVLLHTLVYRVEQVFFIHSATGISIEHVVNEGADSRDAVMVSAMLTAIQDFVQDCLASGKDGALESMRHGEFTFMVEKSPLAYLACIVRGTPPESLREQMHICLETLLVKYADELERFDGDTAPFVTCRPYMEQLLDAHYVDEGKPAPLWTKMLFGLVFLAIIGAFGYWQYENHLATEEAAAFRQQMREAVNLLRHEPGIEVTHINMRENAPWEVFCLKDRLARSPEEVMLEHSVDPSKFSFQISPHTSHEPIIVEKNVKQALNLPPGVNMVLDAGGSLTLSGTAPMEWILMAGNKAALLPGVTSVDMSALSDPRMNMLKEMTSVVENVTISFPLNSDIPYAEEMPRLVHAVDMLVTIEHLAETMGLSVSLSIYGHADPTGTDKRNYELSQARARTIAAMLYNRESSMPVYAYGMGADQFPGATGYDARKRKIEMRLRFTSSVQGLRENFKF